MPDDAGPDARPWGWRFIDLAALGRNGARLYAAALLRIVLWSLAAAIVFAFVHPSGAIGPLFAVIGRYGPIVVAGIAGLWSVERGHRRPWRSLVAPDLRIDGRRLAIGGGVELAILTGQLALVHALTGWPWRLAAPAALSAFLVAAVLIPLQAASEELLFRGYMTQAFGRLVRSRAAIAAAVGLVFGLLHLQVYGPLTMPYFFVLSAIFSLVSLRDERLELVIGGHAAMNLFAFTAANTALLAPGALGAPALGAPSAMPFNWAAVLLLIVHGGLFYGLTRALVRLFCDRRAAR